MTAQQKTLPFGQSDFTALRRSNAVYVDKTPLIHQLAAAPGGVFLYRSPRFGKSLLLSTLASLFEFGLRDFGGLAIESLWTDKKTYDVVRLDFSNLKGFRNAGEFSEQFRRHLCKEFSRVGCELSPANATLLAGASGFIA